MKYRSVSLLFKAVILIMLLPFSVNATKYSDAGSSANYNLYSGDTLLITAGTYTGYITHFDNGAVIIISASATFKPGNIYNPSGKIINYGTTSLGSYGIQGGSAMDNYGILSINGDIMLYDGAVQNWHNHMGANIFITGDLSVQSVNFTNDGNIAIGGAFNMYSPNSIVRNTGYFNVKGTMTMSNGQWINEHNFNTADLNIWGGSVVNNGLLVPKGNMIVGMNSTYTNNCKLNTDKSFTNYGATLNNGLLWTGNSGTSSDEFTNSGTFTNSAGATERSVNFTNYKTITGSGSYYISGNSYNSGKIGSGGYSLDTIIVYDASRSGSSIFDTQYGTVYPNVVYRSFSSVDMTASYTGCSAYLQSVNSTPLPVIWNYFYLKLQQNKPQLFWSALYEPNMKFTVERSYDENHFEKAYEIISNNTAVYSYTDVDAEIFKSSIFYRIKALSADGSVKYSSIKVCKPEAVLSQPVCYPNPAKDKLTISYNANKNQDIFILISDMFGHQLLRLQQTAEKGMNHFPLEINKLHPGTYIIQITTNNQQIFQQEFIKAND